MPLCGFNKKMLEGLQAFNEGLVEHGLIHRSSLNDESMDQAVKRELSDMTRLLSELSRIDDVSKRMLTKGLVTYVMGFYLFLRARGVDTIPKEYHTTIDFLSKYFFSMDEKYYGELEGRPEDMKELATFLNGLN